MARFYSRKKFKIKKTAHEVQSVITEIDQTVQYVRQWQRDELARLLLKTKTQTPVCVKIDSNTYIVGRYAIKKQNNIWYSMDSRDETEYQFNSKLSAVLHALCDIKGRNELAKEILEYDNRVLKLSNDLEIYKHRRRTSYLKKNYWRSDYFKIREDSAKYQLVEAKKQLQKSIELAKYYKIWMS